MNEYTDQTLTVDDLQKDERGSTFTNCVFEADGDKVIDGICFSFAEFTGCTWNTECRRCSFRGVEGDSLPTLAVISFDEPPADGLYVRDDKGSLFRGDGVTVEFSVLRLDTDALSAALEKHDLTGFTITAGKVAWDCALRPSAKTRQEFLGTPRIELTTDAVDTADPINGIPDIPADGTSSCSIIIKKRDRAGNYLTDVGDNDTIDLECSRGKLSALRINIVNGEASVTLTSIAETCVSEVKAKVEGMEPVIIRIQFAP